MSFKKSKIPTIDISAPQKNSKYSELREAYLASKKRNVFSAIFLGIVALSAIFFLANASLDQVGNFKFDFSFLSSISPMSILSGWDELPEKMNILLAGIWGGSHDWAELTDTLMLASVNTKLKTVSMLSIPRDLYVEYPSGGWGRINELYKRGIKVYGKEKGIKYLKEKLAEITGEPVDHFAIVDFDGFRKFIDLLDGLQVDVPEDLVDTEYPDENWGYETFSVKKGSQTFDGDTTLKYVRSRHSTSDFDRSLRQQLVIKTIKDKLLQLDYIGNPAKLKAIYSTISEHIITDFSIKDLLSMALLAKDVKNDHILSFNLNDSCFQSVSLCQRGGFLYSPARAQFGGAAVLLPDGATATDPSVYTAVQKFANLVFNHPQMFIEKFTVHIVNSTKVSGLANKLALLYKKYGFNVPEEKSIWSTKDSFPKSEIFYRYDDITKTWVPTDSKTLEALWLFVLGAQTQTGQLNYAKAPGADIEVVIGDDYKLFLEK